MATARIVSGTSPRGPPVDGPTRAGHQNEGGAQDSERRRDPTEQRHGRPEQSDEGEGAPREAQAGEDAEPGAASTPAGRRRSRSGSGRGRAVRGSRPVQADRVGLGEERLRVPFGGTAGVHVVEALLPGAGQSIELAARLGHGRRCHRGGRTPAASATEAQDEPHDARDEQSSRARARGENADDDGCDDSCVEGRARPVAGEGEQTADGFDVLAAGWDQGPGDEVGRKGDTVRDDRRDHHAGADQERFDVPLPCQRGADAGQLGLGGIASQCREV